MRVDFRQEPKIYHEVAALRFFVLLLFDLRTSLLILFAGMLFGYLTFMWSHPESFAIVSGTVTVNQIMATLFASLVIGGLFARNKQLIEEVKIRALKVEEANQVKTEFLYNMRHDIRTPFSGILGLSQVMRDKESDPVKKEQLSMIAFSAETLLLYLNEILEFMQLESGSVPIILKPIDLHELIESVTDAFKASVYDKHITLTSSYKNLPEWLIGDRFRIQRILINLISNAVKFTSQGFIAVSAYLIEEKNNKLLVGLSVEDTGIGISEDNHTVIFNKFEKIGSSYDASNSGVGLGLHAVKSLVSDLGGEVFLKSKLGSGSTFTCVIPFQKTLIADKEILSEISGSDNEGSVNIVSAVDKINQLKKQPHRKVTQNINHNKPHVLLIEDSRIAQMAALSLLESTGLYADAVNSGYEGVEQFKSKKYDLVLLDIGLPDIDGYSVAKLLREYEVDHYKKHVPIIVLTAHVDDVLHSKNEQYITSILKKPLSKDHISSIKDEYLSGFEN